MTTYTKAAIIQETGVLIGSIGEGGYVFVWRKRPNKYAIKTSGQGTVVIAFTTNAAFEPDTGISDPRIKAYGPLKSVLRGPIIVNNVQILG